MDDLSRFNDQPLEKKSLYLELCQVRGMFDYCSDFGDFVSDLCYNPEDYTIEQIVEVLDLAKQLNKKILWLKHRKAIEELRTAGFIITITE